MDGVLYQDPLIISEDSLTEETQILDNFGLNGYSNCELIKPENLDYWCLKAYKQL